MDNINKSMARVVQFMELIEMNRVGVVGGEEGVGGWRGGGGWVGGAKNNNSRWLLELRKFAAIIILAENE